MACVIGKLGSIRRASSRSTNGISVMTHENFEIFKLYRVDSTTTLTLPLPWPSKHKQITGELPTSKNVPFQELKSSSQICWRNFFDKFSDFLDQMTKWVLYNDYIGFDLHVPLHQPVFQFQKFQSVSSFKRLKLF